MSNAYKLANEASVYQSTFSLVHETMYGLYKKEMEVRSIEHDQENRNNAKISSIVSSMIVSKGFNKNWFKRFETIVELCRTSTNTRKPKP